MRDWTKLLLIVCVVALGAGLFALERRIAGLEAEMAAAPARAHSVRVASHEVPAPQPLRLELRDGLQAVPLQQGAPRAERQPSGIINGIPYYFIPLSE